MERITMSIDEELAKEFDALASKRGYASRSEAMRDLLRREVEAQPGRATRRARTAWPTCRTSTTTTSASSPSG